MRRILSCTILALVIAAAAPSLASAHGGHGGHEGGHGGHHGGHGGGGSHGFFSAYRTPSSYDDACWKWIASPYWHRVNICYGPVAHGS
jgi:hypothetical protein